uniref:Enoyl-CoA hydratase n=1 Tax=Plectus sambesii TaxID=2011161 RepID=A0A914VU60_9BILA
MSLSSQAQNLVVTETQGPVRLIGINRAKKRNCVNHATALQLIDAFDQFESDDSVKVGILHGKGGTFCAGYDLSEVAGGEIVDAETAVSFLQQYRFMGPSIMRFSKPVIAAIDGFRIVHF